MVLPLALPRCPPMGSSGRSQTSSCRLAIAVEIPALPFTQIRGFILGPSFCHILFETINPLLLGCRTRYAKMLGILLSKNPLTQRKPFLGFRCALLEKNLCETDTTVVYTVVPNGSYPNEVSKAPPEGSKSPSQWDKQPMCLITITNKTLSAPKIRGSPSYPRGRCAFWRTS